ncbi:MAG: PDDEXK nuclease domain-containing protein [Bacteroidota bacterium]
MNKLSSEKGYQQLLTQIDEAYQQGQRQANRAVNAQMVITYWTIGQYIVEFEQEGEAKAEYGQNLMDRLSRDLQQKYGKGFSRSNLSYMRRMYLYFPIRETVSHELSWSHYFELVKIKDELERSFYFQQTLKEKWSVRELQRQKRTALFQRLAISKDKEEVLRLSQQGQILEKPEDILRDPYVFEFLGLPERVIPHEAKLEQLQIDPLQQFLLELGKGFAFLGRQYRISMDNRHFYVDLVFYHRILKCFVLIDLKTQEVGHEDVGQMNLYLNYIEQEENQPDDNPPIGIILGTGKNEVSVSYALAGLDNQVFVSQYQLYLPDPEELRRLVAMDLERYGEE